VIKQSFQDLPEQILALAKQAGVETAEVLQTQSTARPVVFEANRLKQLETSESEGTALRLWQEGRPGLVVAYGPVDPAILVEKALALSALNEPETPELMAGEHQDFAEQGTSVPVEQLVAWGEEAIDRIRGGFPEVLCEGVLDCETDWTRLVNSEGLDYRYQATTLSWDLGAEWVRGDDFLSVWEGEVTGYTLTPATVVERILQRLAWAADTVECPQRQVPVVFTGKAADLLWGTAQAALNGKRVLEQSTPWSNRRGQQVLSDQVTLWQDPTQGPYGCPFDDEGVLTQPLQLIQAGVLQEFYCDRKTGRALGQPSTGNGFRSELGSYPTPSLVNTLIQPGSRTLTEILGDLEEAVVVDQVLGEGPGISGELSINLDLGYRVCQGEILGRLKDTMIAGNVYAVLKRVLEIANDRIWNGACYTPSLVVDGLSITGRR
jgi:PmbA protein